MSEDGHPLGGFDAQLVGGQIWVQERPGLHHAQPGSPCPAVSQTLCAGLPQLHWCGRRSTAPRLLAEPGSPLARKRRT
eukprot:1633975-Pyramimonas_sp.AAC.1